MQIRVAATQNDYVFEMEKESIFMLQLLNFTVLTYISQKNKETLFKK